jgi:hypothetical protein
MPWNTPHGPQHRFINDSAPPDLFLNHGPAHLLELCQSGTHHRFLPTHRYFRPFHCSAPLLSENCPEGQ